MGHARYNRRSVLSSWYFINLSTLNLFLTIELLRDPSDRTPDNYHNVVFIFRQWKQEGTECGYVAHRGEESKYWACN